MGALAQIVRLAAAREVQTSWAAARKGPAHDQKIQLEAKRPWKIDVELARAVAIAAVVRIVMVLAPNQRRLVKEGLTLGLRLCAGVLGRRGVHDGASFFLRRRIRERRLALLQRSPKGAIPQPTRKFPRGLTVPFSLPGTLRQK
jgi:hypothetical protein